MNPAQTRHRPSPTPDPAPAPILPRPPFMPRPRPCPDLRSGPDSVPAQTPTQAQGLVGSMRPALTLLHLTITGRDWAVPSTRFSHEGSALGHLALELRQDAQSEELLEITSQEQTK